MAKAVSGKIQSAKCNGDVWKYKLNVGTYTISNMQDIENANAKRRFRFENKYLPKALP